ncbi:MFS transporter [Luteipulveratus mongoliensis]|uniref:MFS transporter n=1 Tax=Luteipulveratus mongoliensis TaxID=571913 RepID=A0A0K1JNT5_9MICO|nr:MFS transporter [Luteipulveratus mongoliensis]AKU18376.1 MFS transporter [Luteipulveratus mongoliensis]
MLSAYLPLLRTPGARRFVLGAALARTGGAMFGVAVVAMVSGRRESYGLAGAVSAVGLVVLALTAAVVGRLIDRFGQRRVTLPLAFWSALWGSALIVLSLTSAPAWTLFVAYGCSAVVASTGTMSRARWSHLLADEPERLHTAMSFEQVIDELSFVAGPALAVLLSTQVFPEAGLIVAGLCYSIGSLVFLSARATEPPVHPGSHESTGLALLRPGIALLSVVMFMTGAIFGSNEVTTIAVAEDLGQKGWSGLVLALFAVGSASAGLIYGARAVSLPLSTSLLVGTVAMVVLEAPVLLAHSIFWLSVVMLIAGVATAPTLITSMNLSQRLVPARQVNEAMSIVLTGLIIGVAAGSAASGWVIEQHGAHDGFWVPVIAGAAAVVLAALGQRALRRA